MYREFLIKEADELGGPSADRARPLRKGFGGVRSSIARRRLWTTR